MAMLAHQGGWDEILLVLGPILVIAGLLKLAKRRVQRTLAAIDTMPPGTTLVTRRIDAPRATVYRALLDPTAVQRWMVPDGMSSVVHSFDAREGGTFRISLAYDDPAPGDVGKTDAHTDTFHGRFQTLLPDTQVVQVIEFETTDPAMAGEMTVTYQLSDTADGTGTEVVGLHEHLPPGVAPADNEAGWRMSLHKLAALLEDGSTDDGRPGDARPEEGS